MKQMTFNKSILDLVAHKDISKDLYDKYMYKHEGLIQLQDILNYQFNNIELLVQSLSHKTFVNEFSLYGPYSYERLEFVGDSIVGAIVSSSLFLVFPSFDEGELSKLKSSLVNEKSLANIALSFNLGQYILLGKGEIKEGHRKSSILSDVLEAVIGAVFLDGGYQKAYLVFDELLAKSNLKESFYQVKEIEKFDPKSQLQEWTMKEYKNLPDYREVEENGIFKIELYINDKYITTTQSISKKEAKKEAAQFALSVIEDDYNGDLKC